MALAARSPRSYTVGQATVDSRSRQDPAWSRDTKLGDSGSGYMLRRATNVGILSKAAWLNHP